MANLNGFDANTVEPQTAMTPIPAGTYKVAITESEMKETSKKNGSYLALVFSVLDGEHKNRKLYTNLNLDNPNKVAVEIARSELSAICRAVNVMTPSDSAELHNRPLVVKVGLEKRNDTGEMRNVIKGYESLASATAEPAMAAAGDKPWG